MKIINDSEILNIDFRQQFLQDITGSLNTARKNFMKRRYDVFKDDTKKYVLEYFKNESASGEEILEEIKNRASNISFCRKIIDKKCLVYKDGAKREVVDQYEAFQSAIDLLIDMLNLNSVMKKVNKYEELFKNSLVQVVPYESQTGWRVKLNVLPPFLYDVIEDANNPEAAKVIVFSNYNPKRSQANYTAPEMSGFRNKTTQIAATEDLNQIMIDLEYQPNDEPEYVWWSDNYHFTTDSKGEIIQGRQEPDLSNPIGELPFVDFSRDKDGNFWVLGGEDIVEGSILLNVLLTDLYFIAKFQGMGIGYMFGKGVPKNMKVGPSSFVTLEVEQGDPTPALGFASSQPPIESHIRMIEGYLAYLLSTNNLEAGSIVGSLNATTAASGIQEVIRRAENIDDIEDQQEIYKDNEPDIFRITLKWLNLYFDLGLLDEKFKAIGKIPENIRVVTKFSKPHTFLSEKERLDVIEKRLALGLDSKLDAIMRDNPDLTKDEAIEKLARINEESAMENMAKMKMFQSPIAPVAEMPMDKMTMMESEEDEDEEEEDVEDGEDNIQAKTST